MSSKTPDKIGRYTVDRLLGQGAMGSVYLGRDPALDRKVAIKTVRDLELDDQHKRNFLERFKNEAKAAARLSHPSIVQVYDVGEEEGLGPFLVFEYVAGSTLKHILRDRGALAPAHVISIISQIGGALDVAHAAGIIHRDVKPDNILVADDGRAKLADFGVARLPDAALTREGQFLGTPCYAAPETLSHGKYSPRSDLFSFAAVVYELVSGVRAFPGSDAIAVAHNVIHDAPIPPSEAGIRALPIEVDQVVLRGLSKDPAERYATATELVDELEATYAELGLLDAALIETGRSVGGPSGSSWAFAGVLLGVAVGGMALVFALSGIGGFGSESGADAGPDASSADGGTLLVDLPVEEVDAGPSSFDAATDSVDATRTQEDATSWQETEASLSHASMSRLEREEAAKDAIERARRLLDQGDREAAMREVERARDLDPGSSDLEELEGRLRQL